MKAEPRDPRLNPRKLAAVQIARAAWERRLRNPAGNINRKVLLSFDELLDAFSQPCMRFSDMALALGVSRERVRQIWRDHFSDLFDGRTGQQRRRVCTIATTLEKERTAEPVGKGAIAAELARGYGLNVEAVTTRRRFTVLVLIGEIQVNGHRVLVRTNTRSFCQETSLRGYYRFVIRKSLQKYHSVIFLVGPLPVPFVIPASALERDRMYYVPDDFQPTTYAPTLGHQDNDTSQVNTFLAYRDAWHLLDDKQQEKAS